MTHLAVILRPHRFELRAFTAATAVVALLALLLIARLGAFGIPEGCFGPVKPDECGLRRADIDAYFAFADVWAAPILIALAVLPLLGGVILGVALGAKELDQRTSVLAWSISPSRLRWLRLRLIPVAAAVAIIGAGSGVLGDVVQGLRAPSEDPTRSFDLIWFRGVVEAGVGLSAFGLTVFVGSTVGRVLPALLIAAAIVGATVAGVALANEGALAGETVYVVVAGQPISGRVIDSRVLTPDGRIITLEEAYDRYGEEATQIGGDSELRLVAVVNPGEIYPLAVARAAVAHIAIGLAALLATFFVVDRRRP